MAMSSLVAMLAAVTGCALVLIVIGGVIAYFIVQRQNKTPRE